MAQPFVTIGRTQNDGRSPLRALLVWLLIVLVTTGLTACQRPAPRLDAPVATREYPQPHGTLTEVAPPAVLNDLRSALDRRRPQVKILSPKPNETLTSTTVDVRLDVRDLSLFLNPDLGLGPHVHLLLDNQPYQAIYDVSKPVQLTDLSPGSHSLRVFAVRPWHESFKNEGAYAQVSFNVFTASPENQPTPKAPLLTYSRPKGSYGAEPILLDFYLTNAPLHALASGEAEESPDWRIRVTVNGESFLLDDWQPVWLKGFRPGLNWVKTELLDDKGRPLETSFNTTVRLMEFQPGGEDAYSKLVRGELSAAAAFGIVDPTYQPPPEPALSPSKDEREVKKGKVIPSETTPVANPEHPPSAPAVESKVQPEKVPAVQPSSPVQPPAVPLPAAEQPALTLEEPAEPAPPVSPETTGSRLQRQFSTYLQRFRRQPRVAPQPEATPAASPAETSPAEPPSPLPLEPSTPEEQPEDLSPTGQEDSSMPEQTVEQPPGEVESSVGQPSAAPPAEEPTQSQGQSVEPAPALLDQAKEGAGKFLQELGQQSQAQGQKLQRQLGEYLQRFRSQPASSGEGSALNPSTGLASPAGAAKLPAPDAADQVPPEPLSPASIQPKDQAEESSTAQAADRTAAQPDLDDPDAVGTALDRPVPLPSSAPDLPSSPATPSLWQRLQSLRLEDLARRLQPQSLLPSPEVTPEP